MNEPGPMVLAVDDDPDVLEFYRIILQGGGYRVECFTDADRAFEFMTEQCPDLVITDLMMGALDTGFSFVAEIREHLALKSVPVIIVTAVSSQRGFSFVPQGEEDLAAMQVEAFFTKPVEPKDLLATVRDLLKRSRQ